MVSTWLVLGVGLLMFLAVWVTMWFCKNTSLEMARWENEDFRQVVDRYEKMVATLAEETRSAKILKDVVEAMNLNTKSLDLLEKATNQLILRQVGFQDRTSKKQTQVGEEGAETKIGNRTVITRTPETRTDSGEEGFVDLTSGAVVPAKEPTAREIAAMPPT